MRGGWACALDVGVQMNIGEIAKRAGVSRSTVSYALSGKRPIADETKRRIFAVMEQENYRPSATARALSSGSTSTIGLVIPPLHHHLSAAQLKFVGAVAEAASERDHDTLLSPSGDNRRSALDRLIGEKRVDGLVLMETRVDDDRVLRLIEAGFPFVTIGRTGVSEQHNWVDLDYDGLVRQAVAHLGRLGHRHIGLVNRPAELLSLGYISARLAESAFEQTVRSLGVSGHSVCSEDDDADAARCLRELRRMDRELSAIVTINERSLRGLVETAGATDLAVGERLALMAVAPDRLAGSLRPAVTNADVPAAQMGRVAVDALLDQIAAPDKVMVQRLLSPNFTDRGSTPRPALLSAHT